MNILLVTLNVPRPTWGAGTRNEQVLRALAREHSVSLVALAEDYETAAHDAEELRPLTRDIQLVALPVQRSTRRLRQLLAVAQGESYLLTTYCPPVLRQALETRLCGQRYDAVVFESVLVAGYRPPSGVRVILDQHNIEHELVRRTVEHETAPLRKWFNQLEYRPLREGELARCRAADVVLVPSERERQVLSELLPESTIQVAPNGVDSSAFSSDGTAFLCEETPGSVIFTGTMAYHPNVQGALRFARECWPLVRTRAPEATWQIVGRMPPPEVQRLAQLPGVTVTGTVPAIQPYLASASVAIAPLIVGSGTRLKILEALAMGKALVTTRLGCEGIPLVSGRHALVADDPEHFAEAVVTLLHDSELRARLGAAGRALVEERYTWDRCLAPLLDAVEQPGISRSETSSAARDPAAAPA
jgi:polysaccharide biosynthesis protein PslH